MQKSNKLIPALAGVILTVAVLIGVIAIVSAGNGGNASPQPQSGVENNNGQVLPPEAQVGGGADYDSTMLAIYRTYRDFEEGLEGIVGDVPGGLETCWADSDSVTTQQWPDVVAAIDSLFVETSASYRAIEIDIRADNKHLAGDIAWGIADHYLQLVKVEHNRQSDVIFTGIAEFATRCGLPLQDGDIKGLTEG